MVPQSSWLLLQVLSFICFPLVFSISPLCAHLFVSVCGRDFAVHVSDWTLCSNHSPAPDNGGPYLKAEAQPLLDHWTKQLVVTLAPVFALFLLCFFLCAFWYWCANKAMNQYRTTSSTVLKIGSFIQSFVSATSSGEISAHRYQTAITNFCFSVPLAQVPGFPPLVWWAWIEHEKIVHGGCLDPPPGT